MSVVTDQPSGGSEGDPGATPPTGQPAGGTPSGATAPPEGFVSRAELEREQARARQFQGETDRLKARLEALEKPSGSGVKPEGSAFDPDEFRRSVIRDATSAIAVARASETLRAEFPHADESLFAPERLAEFGSIDSLRLAVEASHTRVASILSAEKAKMEEEIRREFAEKHGVSYTPPTGGAPAPTGDPTPEQLARMSDAEWTALEERSPGVIERVLRAAS